MTRKEIIDKLDNVEKEVKEIREFLSQSEAGAGTSVGFPLAIEPDFELGYMIEDLYRAFGDKKSLTHRLQTALQK